MTVRLFLDIDGVLNANLAGGPHPTMRHNRRKGIAGGYRMDWNAYIIDELNALDVKPVWATTWRDQANSLISPLMGIGNGEWDVLHPYGDWKQPTWPHGITASIEWKIPEVQRQVLIEPGPFIHVDDEFHTLAQYTEDGLLIQGHHAWANEVGGLIIGPHPQFGITPEHIDQMKQYIREHA